MTGRWEITRQALRTGRRTLAIWAASLAGLIALYAVIWPSVRGNNASTSRCSFATSSSVLHIRF